MTEAQTPPQLVIDGSIATITLNRPRYRNRIEADDLALLHAHLDRLEGESGVRVLVLTGTGPVFSSGYHLGDLVRRDREAEPRSEDLPKSTPFEVLVDRLEDFALPTICRLNGGVYGGATDLALACDFRLADDAAEMFMPAGRLGIHYYPGGIARFVSRLGPGAAKHLFLTADRIGAKSMLRIGYLTEIVPRERLDVRVAELAATLAANAPKALRGMKRTINEFARGEFDRWDAARRHRESLGGEEVAEGLRAFAEKRLPAFPD